MNQDVGTDLRINGQDVPAKRVYWLTKRLCVDMDESVLCEIKPLLAEKNLTISAGEQTFSGWISIHLSYGYLEIRECLPGSGKRPISII